MFILSTVIAGATLGGTIGGIAVWADYASAEWLRR